MIPYTDNDSQALIATALAALVLVRAPMWQDDPGPRISVLVSLAAEAESGLFEAVADAREHGYSWEQIGSRLAAAAASARRRYGSYAALQPVETTDD
jgi:hypothetical protein